MVTSKVQEFPKQVILLDSSGNNQVLTEKIDKDEKRCYRRIKRLENKKGLKERTRNNN
ncbi:MAG: hypothetical protein QN650_11190 [Nitrososphaeraceae archaeon]|nr:hypothetical protein [Nitrososphaeraceae archaeon]